MLRQTSDKNWVQIYWYSLDMSHKQLWLRKLGCIMQNEKWEGFCKPNLDNAYGELSPLCLRTLNLTTQGRLGNTWWNGCILQNYAQLKQNFFRLILSTPGNKLPEVWKILLFCRRCCYRIHSGHSVVERHKKVLCRLINLKTQF